MDPKPFNMALYDSLGVFKPIFGDFDFFRFVYSRAAPVRAARYLTSCKIIKKNQKYVKVAVFGIKMAPAVVKKSLKHIFTVLG